MHYKFKLALMGFLIIAVTAGISYAAFTDKGKVLGSKFTVGSSDIKLLADVTGGTGTSNLADEVTGPEFNNIYPFWAQNHFIKIFNNGTSGVTLTSNANYLTVNDPDDLRSIIFVEPFEWNDTDNDGAIDEGETGTSYGRKTIVKWKTEGFLLGTINQGEVKSLILKFSADSISETKQGKSGIFDFEFDSVSL